MLPPSGATLGSNDAVTRTFSLRVVAEFDFPDGGTGIYSPSTPCPLVVFGLRPNVPDLVYYQGARVATNLESGDVPFTGLSPVPVANPCPIPGSGAGQVHLVVADMTVFAPYDGVGVDQLVCTKRPDADCIPDAATGLAVLYRCGWQGATFTASPPDGKGALPAGVGSRSIGCTDDPLEPSDGPRNATVYYDGAPQGYCDDWFFAAGGWGTDFCVIQDSDLVPYDDTYDDTGYIVSNLFIDALVTDYATAPPTVTTESFADCDFLLVLDLDGYGFPDTWADALQKHATNLAGWYDLGGNQVGCAKPAGGLPAGGKAKGLPGPPFKEPLCIISNPLPAGANGPSCADAACSGASGPDDYVVTCEIRQGCQKHPAFVKAFLSEGVSVRTQLLCDDVQKAGTVDAMPDAKAEFGMGQKEGGKYECVVTFTVMNAPPALPVYSKGIGTCSGDKLA